MQSWQAKTMLICITFLPVFSVKALSDVTYEAKMTASPHKREAAPCFGGEAGRPLLQTLTVSTADVVNHFIVEEIAVPATATFIYLTQLVLLERLSSAQGMHFTH